MTNRCFISINLPEKVILEIVKIQKQLEKENLFVGKFTEPENLHLTLKFLGEVDEDKIEDIKERLGKIKSKSFETELGECGFFDNRKSKRFPKKFIIWIHLTNCENLQKEVDKALSGLFEKEKRFMSHLTITRVKKIKDKIKLIEFLNKIKTRGIKFNVDKFYLMESKLSKKGSEYSVIEEFILEN